MLLDQLTATLERLYCLRSVTHLRERGGLGERFEKHGDLLCRVRRVNGSGVDVWVTCHQADTFTSGRGAGVVLPSAV